MITTQICNTTLLNSIEDYSAGGPSGFSIRLVTWIIIWVATNFIPPHYQVTEFVFSELV